MPRLKWYWKLAAARKISERERHSKFTARVQHSRVDWSDSVDILSQYMEKARFVRLFFQNQLNTVSLKFADKCWSLMASIFWCTLKSWPWKDLNNSLFSPMCPQPVNQISIGGQAVKQELDIVWYQQNQDEIDGIIRIWRNRDLGLGE